jgi:hypothetical protein
MFYLWIHSERKQRKARIKREAAMPALQGGLQIHMPYNLKLNDGSRFNNVMLLGTINHKVDNLLLNGWEKVLVLKNAELKKIYIRSSAARWIEEF